MPLAPTLTTLCLIALLLTGCGSQGDHYPADWPPLASKSSAASVNKGCPDLRGTYVFEATAVDGTTFGALSTVLGVGVTQTYGAPLTRFTIAGDAASVLTITYSRARSALTGSGTAPESQMATAVYGVDYRCDGGWLVGSKRDMVIKTAHHNSIHRGEVSYRTGSAGPQAASFRRDVDGALVAYANVRESRVFSLWAETGAGIPYWFDTRTYWARWTPVYDTGSATKANPATMGRLERQEYELENGVGSYAAAVAAAKSSTTATTNATAPSVPQTPEATRTMVARYIDRNASLEDVRREGDRYVLTLRVTARGQVTRTIENLSDDATFTDIQDHGIITGGNQTDIATISLRRIR
jgi:hypothetical protein